ncbi:MAG TPA: hypothetical protein DCW59_05840 [Alteromonas sp.]|nr:hypothetical protein [Alteromonadaceae bacterium]HAU91859.1 hypothetical protein [Alteromonas sp.]|tara:strand:+ start:955 stop:1170 length:216 start_codon:yes stop_codon:yes gene_type:complete
MQAALSVFLAYEVKLNYHINTTSFHIAGRLAKIDWRAFNSLERPNALISPSEIYKTQYNCLMLGAEALISG